MYYTGSSRQLTKVVSRLMDFMNRGFRNGQPNTQQADQTTHAASVPSKTRSSKTASTKFGKAGKIGFVVLVAALLILATVSFFTLKGEARLVDGSKYQAVFLNGGQVYFGKVDAMNNDYINLKQVYYLRVNQQVQPDANAQASSNDISLVKLGCELHGPEDQMVINRDQVIFWENLKGDGQVADAIKQYKEQYPNGQQCNEQNSSSTNQSTNNSSETSQQPSGTSETQNNSQTTQPTQR